MFKESRMSKAVTPSLTRKLFNMALEIGDDVINLTLGDPDLLPPENIRRAACDAIMRGKTRYSANAGLEDARKAYANFFSHQYGMVVSAKENVMVTVGGMEALFLGLSSVLDMDDEVIILGPYYVNYLQMIKMCGAKAVIINRLSKTEGRLLDEISQSCNDKTVGIIINTPCNPVGDILPTSLLSGIAKIAVEKDLLVFADEVYSSLVYDGAKSESIIHQPQMKERTILIDSCSKRFAMTGWRLGFAVGPAEIIANMTKMQENVAACAPLPSQYAAIEAYDNCDFDYSYIKNEYEHRRTIVYDSLKTIELLDPIYPQATFYCFVNISKTGLTSEEFAYRLLAEQHVAVVPGVAYGNDFNNYVRIAFTLEYDLLKTAMQRISDFCNSLYYERV